MIESLRRLLKLVPVLMIGILVYILSIPTVLPDTKYLDYKDPIIIEVARNISTNTTNNYERILKTAQYVHENIMYQDVGLACFNETSTDVLKNKEGNCVSTSKLTASILSAMNIPTTLVEGCLFRNQIIDGRLTRVNQLSIPTDINAKLLVSRKSTGVLEGQLHNWVRAYDGKHWQTIETTAGIVFLSDEEPSMGYNKFGGFVNPADQSNLCLLEDNEFVNYCIQS